MAATSLSETLMPFGDLPRSTSAQFIALLQDLDAQYPPEVMIRLILDHHSAHISKQTRAILGTRPNRFKYIHTPARGSWLKILETSFGEMAHLHYDVRRLFGEIGIDSAVAPVVHGFD